MSGFLKGLFSHQKTPKELVLACIKHDTAIAVQDNSQEPDEDGIQTVRMCFVRPMPIILNLTPLSFPCTLQSQQKLTKHVHTIKTYTLMPISADTPAEEKQLHEDMIEALY